jgi:hypothetical protein
LGQQYPEVYSNYKKLNTAILEAWDTITDKEIRYLIRTKIKVYCQAVIDTEGKETKY